MQSLDVIAQFGVWLWFALAVALFVLESIVPGVHFVWFGVSAAVVGVIALLTPIAWPWQLIVFALVVLVNDQRNVAMHVGLVVDDGDMPTVSGRQRL